MWQDDPHLNHRRHPQPHRRNGRDLRHTDHSIGGRGEDGLSPPCRGVRFSAVQSFAGANCGRERGYSPGRSGRAPWGGRPESGRNSRTDRHDAHLGKLPSQLSGGEQQRVAIARAVVHAPRLIVCDEPTAALDAETGQTVLEILKETALVPDRAVIVVTHDTRIFRFADRIVAIEDGRIGSVRSAALGELAEVA